MVLSLQQSLEMALLNNLELQGARLDVQVAEARVNGAKGPFDPVFFGYFQHRNDVEPQVSLVESTFTNGIFDIYQFGFRQELVYGGSYEVTFGTTRTERGQDAGLTPAYQANLAMKYTQPLLKGLPDAELVRLAAEGQLVIVSLKASDAIDAVFRLMALGIAPDQVARTLVGSLASSMNGSATSTSMNCDDTRIQSMPPA